MYRITLSALLLLRDHLTGFGTTAETCERVDALLRPLRCANGLLLPVLQLNERIAELEPLFPEAMQARGGAPDAGAAGAVLSDGRGRRGRGER